MSLGLGTAYPNWCFQLVVEIQVAFIQHISLAVKIETAPQEGTGRQCSTASRAFCKLTGNTFGVASGWEAEKVSLHFEASQLSLFYTTGMQLSSSLQFLHMSVARSGRTVLLVHDIISCSIKFVTFVLAFYTRTLRGQNNLFLCSETEGSDL